MNPLPVVITGVVIVAVPPLRRRVLPVVRATAVGAVGIAGATVGAATGLACATAGAATGVVQAAVSGSTDTQEDPED